MKVIDEATAAVISDPIDVDADALSFQVVGTATSFAIAIEGRVDRDIDDFSELAIFALDDITKLEQVTSTGIYEVAVRSVCQVRVNVKSCSGGDVSVYIRTA